MRFIKMIIFSMLVLCLVGCVNDSELSSSNSNDVPSQSISESESESSSNVEEKPISISSEEVLQEFGSSLLLSDSWNNTSEIPVESLVMWYGYRIQKEDNISKYIQEEVDGLYIPESEFESIIYNYFGLLPEHLRTNYTYNENNKSYVTPAALYDLAKTEYEILKTDYNDDVLTIHFNLIISSGEPKEHVLSAKITQDQILFISYR